MKAVRSIEGGVAVVDVDEPPGIGEVLDIRATSICGSDLSYIRFGSRNILGHELAGVREDGTAVVVEAIYGCMECAQCRRGAYNLCPTHGQRALGIGADGGMAEQFRAPGQGWSRCRRASTCAMPPSWSRPRSRGTHSGSLTLGRAHGSRLSVPARSDCSPWPALVGSAPRRSRSRPPSVPEGSRGALGRAGRG